MAPDLEAIVVTGATGFIGSRLLLELATRGRHARGAGRAELGEIDAGADWRPVLRGATTVVHCLALAHANAEESAIRAVNVDATLRLGEQAAEAGVRRLVFVSSIKAMAERSTRGRPLVETDTPKPEDAYGRAKLSAEQGLRRIARSSGLEVVIVRPVLVHGAGAKGNLAALMRWIGRGLPLPFGGIANRRSLLGAGNLADLLILCNDHPDAAGEVFVAADGEPVSTAELVTELAQAMGTAARLLPVPEGWIETGLSLLGREALADRLVGDLEVDATKARRVLGWSPRESRAESLAAMAVSRDRR